MYKYLNIIILLIFFNSLFSQSKDEISKQIEKTKKEITLTNQLLEEIESNKKDSYNYLVLLNQKLDLRQSYINSLNSEIKLTQNEISITQNKIKQLQTEVRNLKDEYSKMIYYAYINKSSYERLMFILSSDDFNQAYRRIKYYQQYSLYRQDQVTKIKLKQDTLTNSLNKLDSIVIEKNILLAEANKEAKLLSNERENKRQLVSSLDKQSKKLKADLKQKHDLAQKLEKEIERIIAEELKRQEEERRRKMMDDYKYITTIFTEQKGMLPWPTQGVITERFGEHPHPVLKNIKIVNNGIDISTSSNAKVFSIFEGVVSKIIVIPGSNAAILVRHGEYLSVYNNLVDVKVKAGQKVNAKQLLGTVYADKDSKNSVLQLQIWKETEKLNPEEWIKISK
jgi:murein hydrolase activator